jgi:hypothetical protein
MSKKVYIYDAQGMFDHEYVAQEDPKEAGSYIAPERSTDIAPPSAQENQIVMFDTGMGKWEIVADYRGKIVYEQEDGTEKIIEEVGPIPAGFALTKPLALLKAERIGALSTECSTFIVSGFKSSALGAEYSYPAKPTDQQNLSASVLDSLLAGGNSTWTTPFWCADTAGEWAFRPHTATQIQQVGVDGKAVILAAMSKNESLAASVNAATTAEDVAAIVWGDPE